LADETSEVRLIVLWIQDIIEEPFCIRMFIFTLPCISRGTVQFMDNFCVLSVTDHNKIKIIIVN